jgi:hypothetical protein
MPSAQQRYTEDMKLMKTAALAGLAKKLYDEARKPENQARINAAVDKLRQRRAGA